jgi:hypothetical protein
MWRIAAVRQPLGTGGAKGWGYQDYRRRSPGGTDTPEEHPTTLCTVCTQDRTIPKTPETSRHPRLPRVLSPLFSASLRPFRARSLSHLPTQGGTLALLEVLLPPYYYCGTLLQLTRACCARRVTGRDKAAYSCLPLSLIPQSAQSMANRPRPTAREDPLRARVCYCTIIVDEIGGRSVSCAMSP